MSNVPEISIIVPVYKVEEYLSQCIDSILVQTFTNFELLLVDDGSPDRCGEMCEEYAQKDERIRVFHQENAGVSTARNKGLAEAYGKYIVFVDSDDYVDLDMFESMYNSAKKYDADFVRVDNYKERTDGAVLNQNYVPPMHEGVYNQQELREKLLYTQLGLNPSDDGSKYVSCSVWRNIYRKAIIDSLKLQFVSERDLISEDIPFNIDFMMSCERAAVINQKFYHYIVNEKSLTQTYKTDRFAKELVLYYELIRRSKECGIYENCKLRLERHLLTRLRMCIKSEMVGNKNSTVAKKNIRIMINDTTIRKIISTYPIFQMPIKYRFVTWCVKWRWITPLWLIKEYL